jgi:single-strand DNA-binding protein
MSRSRNIAEILGHLGQDPELNYTGDGTAVCNLSVATNEGDDHTEWHSVTCWGDLAEIVNEHLAKGERVFLEGSLRTRQWEDSDGRTRYSTEIHADEVIFLGTDQPGSSNASASGDNSTGQGRQKEPAGGGETREFEPDDQLPF